MFCFILITKKNCINYLLQAIFSLSKTELYQIRVNSYNQSYKRCLLSYYDTTCISSPISFLNKCIGEPAACYVIQKLRLTHHSLKPSNKAIDKSNGHLVYIQSFIIKIVRFLFAETKTSYSTSDFKPI